MGLFDLFKKKSIAGDSITCFSIDRRQYVELIVDSSSVYYNNEIIGNYILKPDGIVVNTANMTIESHGDFSEVATFINKTRIAWLASKYDSITGDMLLGSYVELDGPYISSPDTGLLARHNGNREKGLAAFICAHANFFFGKYHDYFTLE